MAYFHEKTLDDLMRRLLEALLAEGSTITASRGTATELLGVFLELENPRARLSRSEGRGKVFSCLGELCWYLAGSNDIDFISHYIKRYQNEVENGVVYGAYGPRLFGPKWPDQIANVIALLKKRPTSRRAVVQLFDANDLVEEHREIPCTCTIQFLLRDSRLAAITSMRSNDAFLGLPHDVFCFTMLQELVARSLEVEPGTYMHMAGSMHLYDENRSAAEAFLKEGWHTTGKPMPPMPAGDPWSAVGQLLTLEAETRLSKTSDPGAIQRLDPYWADLARLLKIHAASAVANPSVISTVLQQMSSQVFDIYISTRLNSLQEHTTQ